MPPPRIACFHGGGSNGAIFEVQCAKLQALLKDDFEFVYFDGPFQRLAGPGVLPVFEDYAPFRTWFKVDGDGNERGDGSGYDLVGGSGVDRVWDMMEAASPESGEWVGAIGFSQGTRVVGGLLLDQQRRDEAGNARGINLKFGVLCMGGGPPMAKTSRGPGEVEFEERIAIPTLHVHGLKDTFLSNGRKQLATYYDVDAAKLYDVDYHHAMPWVRAEVEQLAHLIREMYGGARVEA